MEYKKIKCKNIKDIYYISECGNIYSTYFKKILSSKKDKDGYLSISLCCNDGIRRMFRIASLVLYTFVGNPPKKMIDPTVNHIDGNILNNHYTNLEWMERCLNSSIRMNTCPGELNGSHILTQKEVHKICELLLSTEMTYDEIGNLYNVEKSTISNIKNFKKWSCVTKNYPLLKYCRIRVRDKSNGRFKIVNPLLNNKELYFNGNYANAS